MRFLAALKRRAATASSYALFLIMPPRCPKPRPRENADPGVRGATLARENAVEAVNHRIRVRRRARTRSAVTKKRLHSYGPRRFDFFLRIGNKQELVWCIRNRSSDFSVTFAVGFHANLCIEERRNIVRKIA